MSEKRTDNFWRNLLLTVLGGVIVGVIVLLIEYKFFSEKQNDSKSKSSAWPANEKGKPSGGPFIFDVKQTDDYFFNYFNAHQFIASFKSKSKVRNNDEYVSGNMFVNLYKEAIYQKPNLSNYKTLRLNLMQLHKIYTYSDDSLLTEKEPHIITRSFLKLRKADILKALYGLGNFATANFDATYAKQETAIVKFFSDQIIYW